MENVLYYIWGTLFIIGISIFVHEFGHLISAKLFGVEVKVFSLGFGPRLFGFKFKETDYRISLLPFGGYVEIESNENIKDSKSFFLKPAWQRFVVLVSGVIINFITAFLALTILIYVSTDNQRKLSPISVLNSAKLSAVLSIEMSSEIISLIDIMVTDEIGAKENIESSTIIFNVSRTAAEAGILNFLIFLIVIINLGLGLLNLMPILPLDGGHVLILGIEKIYGGRLSPKIVSFMQTFGKILILLLIFFALKFDIEMVFFKK